MIYLLISKSKSDFWDTLYTHTHTHIYIYNEKFVVTTFGICTCSTKGKLRILAIYKVLCFDMAQGWMNGAPNDARTHSCRFARRAC